MADVQSNVSHQKDLPEIPFQYHPAYDDRYRGSPVKQQQTNDDRLPSPPPSLPTEEDDDCDEEIRNVIAKASMLSQQRKSKVLPSIPPYVADKQQSYAQQQQPPLSPAHQKRKKYFNLGKSLTSRLVTNAPKYKLFKKSHAKDNDTNNNARRYIISNPIPISETPKASLLDALPTLTPSSPISHQLPSEYFPHDFKKEEEDTRSDTLTTPDLTIDDLYHLVLNMQKGFQLQMNEMNMQILELKAEIRQLKGEEQENENEEFTVQSVTGTASSVRSVTRQMERYGGSGKWFHNEYI
ncbi:5963_t:CDS:2 [Acaulospora colombiana]|uniref:5963_t:CDS:1 n=1 Tax=Acaulospora colombiana TaxID=27376 RepID=A0ACA9MH23_9GLOM|nr:5963_t:CDS:2 [Acaulospora colombiana]